MRPADTRTLRTQLRLRELDKVVESPPGLETDFARAVSSRVHRELVDKRTAGSELMLEAGRSHVTLPETPLALARVR